MSIRTERVARLLQREIADILNKEFDQQLMVTVTDTRVTKDLSIAYVHVSVMGSTPEQRQATFRHLQEQNSQIRAALAGRIRHQLRLIPELRFFLDESLERARRMETLFDRIRAERERREEGS
jgi:ribosome-binding factor A